MIGIDRMVLYSCVLQSIYRPFETLAVNIYINQNTTGLLGKNDTHLACSFTKDINQNLINVAIVARNKKGTFSTKAPIAIFPPGKASILPPSGDYLSGRVTLTNITNVSTNATMMFNELKCEDENDYICTFNYVNDFGYVIIHASEPTRLLVKAYPSMPDSISSLIVSPTTIEKQVHTSSNFLRERNNTLSDTKQNDGISFRTSQSDLETVTYLQLSASPEKFIREGETLRLTCIGNIGKPPGKLVWQIFFPQQNQTITYSNETTDVESVSDICAFIGTSNLIVQILAEHFQAKFRCFEESQANIPGMYVETLPLDVHFHVRHISITRQPNHTIYDKKTSKITLKCKGSGNPEPTYKWFRQEITTRSILSWTNIYIIEDVIQKYSGVYICEAYNTVDDIGYNTTDSVEIDIVDELLLSTELELLEIFEDYAVYVIPVICGVVFTIIICFAVRKRLRKREQTNCVVDDTVVYAEVNEHEKLKYRLQRNQATSHNPEHPDEEHDETKGSNDVSGDTRFKYNMITGKIEVY